MLKVKGKGVHASIVMWLGAVPLLLLGCVQAEAEPNPTAIPTMLPVLAAPTAAPSPTPTPILTPPTPTSFPTPTPSPPEPGELLQQINTAMATASSFHIEGTWVIGETMENGNAGTGLFTVEFEGQAEPGGDSLAVVLMNSNTGSSPVDGSFETRKVDGILYAQDPITGDWEAGGDDVFMTHNAAMAGSLDLENIKVEEVLSANWKPVYRITGDTPNDPETDQLVLLVDAEELRRLELHMEGVFSRRGIEDWDSKPFQLDIRFSDFNQPFEVSAPPLRNADQGGLTTVVQDKNPGKVRSLRLLFGPADLRVVDPDGNVTGVDPLTGAVINEIPGAFYSGPEQEPEQISLVHGGGTATVEIYGTGTGVYTFGVQVLTTETDRAQVFQWTTRPGQVDTFGLSEPMSGPLVLQPLRLTVPIDLRAGRDLDCIYLSSDDFIPVAILSTETFDAADVDQPSLTLEGSDAGMKGKSSDMGRFEDVDGDGDLDLVVQFPTADLELTEADTEAILEGLTKSGTLIGLESRNTSGTPIIGADSICVVS